LSRLGSELGIIECFSFIFHHPFAEPQRPPKTAAPQSHSKVTGWYTYLNTKTLFLVYLGGPLNIKKLLCVFYGHIWYTYFTHIWYTYFTPTWYILWSFAVLVCRLPRCTYQKTFYIVRVLNKQQRFTALHQPTSKEETALEILF
jgi:hypothetical protein